MEDLKKLLAAATPLPWWIASMNPNVVSAGARDVLRCHKSADARGTAPSANAALICAAVNALPELLAENARLRQALQFYADPANHVGHSDPYASIYIETSAVDTDGGERARVALGEPEK